ncbi:MAG: YgeY family selenium metabolism-linked hydrolase [Anaerolineae bacterium]
MLTLSRQDQHNLTTFLRDLVAIPSLSGDERGVAERLKQEMERLGFDEVWIDRVGNVVGRIGPGRGPKLLFDAHMDTVGVGDPKTWSHDPFGAEIENGVLYGRGACDMKGALASMVYGVALLKQSGLPLAGDLYVAGVVQEEPCEGYAVRLLIEEEGIRPNWVILGEPSNLQVSRGHRGRLELCVTVKGRAAHASMPQYGDNAIYSAARLIFALDLLTASLPEDPFLGKGTLAVTQIYNTGGSRNAIPDSCTLIIDRRLTLGETETKALAEIQGVMIREGVRAEIEVAEHHLTSYTGFESAVPQRYPAWVLPEDHPLVQTTVWAVRQATGERPAIGRYNFSTDGAYTMGIAGIPTVGFGPGEEGQAHAADEHIRLADCFTAAHVYAQLAADLLREA